MREELVNKLADILEEERVDLSLKFEDFDEWDSLTILSMVSMVDSDYDKTMTKEQIENFNSVEEFCKFLLNE